MKQKNQAAASESYDDWDDNQNQNGSFGEESAEDFFARLEEQSQPKRKKKRKKKLKVLPLAPAAVEPELAPVEEAAANAYADNSADAYEQNDDIHQDAFAEGGSRKRKKNKKIHHLFDKNDRDALKKAIVFNEVLGKPKAFKF